MSFTDIISLQVLLAYGADLNAVTLDKWTPLHSASHWNSAPCVGKLLLFDVNVNAQTEGGNCCLCLKK